MSHVEIFCLHHLGSDPASDFLSLLFLFLPAAFCPLLFSARSSSLPARRLAALCLLFSHTKPPGTALGRSPAQFFCAGCILFLLPLASLAPSLPKPPSQPMRYLPPPSPTSPSQPLPPDPFLHQGDSSGGGNGTNLYACCVYLTPSPQAANSRRARKGGALSRDLAALSRTDLASRPRTDHLVLISQTHLAPISQSRS